MCPAAQRETCDPTFELKRLWSKEPVRENLAPYQERVLPLGRLDHDQLWTRQWSHRLAFSAVD